MSKLLKHSCSKMSNRAISKHTAISAGIAEFFHVEKCAEPTLKRCRKIPMRRLIDSIRVVNVAKPMPSFIALAVCDGDYKLAMQYLANLKRGMRPSRAASKLGLDECAIKMAASPYTKLRFAQTPYEVYNVYASTDMGQSCMTKVPDNAAWLYGHYYGAGVAHISNARCVVNLIDKLYGRAYGEGAEELIMALRLWGFTHHSQPLLSLPPTIHNSVDMTTATGAPIQYDDITDEYFYVHYCLQPVRDPSYMCLKDGGSFSKDNFPSANVIEFGHCWSTTPTQIAADHQEMLRKHNRANTFEHVIIRDRTASGNQPFVKNGLARVAEFEVNEQRVKYRLVSDVMHRVATFNGPGPQPAGTMYIDGGYTLSNEVNVWRFK